MFKKSLSVFVFLVSGTLGTLIFCNKDNPVTPNVTPPSAPTLVSPANEAVDEPVSLPLVWNKVSTATSYHLQVATDNGFTNIFTQDSLLIDSQKVISGLLNSTIYYWRVKAKNSAGASSAWASNRSITTIPPTPPASINGLWSATTPLVKGGAGAPDTFTCVLTINDAAGTYSMQRGHVNYGSSGSQTDSTKETGTLTKIGTDSLVLTPTGTSCYYFDPGLADWVLCDGTVNAMFRTCPDPIHIKIDISGTTWNVSMPRYDDVTSVTFALKKQ
jgi:hypothetical protein